MTTTTLEPLAAPVELAPRTEGLILSEVYQDIRGLTKHFLSQAKDVDPYQVLMVNGTPFNSLYWIMGHIVWSQHFLILRALADKDLEIPWFDRFERGSELMLDPRSESELPTVEEIMETMDRVHEESMTIIRSLDVDALEESNHLGLRFPAGDSRRVIIRHALRHEPMHIGQITWLTKAAAGAGA